MILYEFRVVVVLDNHLCVFFRRLQKVQQVGADVCVDGAQLVGRGYGGSYLIDATVVGQVARRVFIGPYYIQSPPHPFEIQLRSRIV